MFGGIKESEREDYKMIDANMYVKVEFDEEGKKKIEDAYETLTEIVGALKSVGAHTSEMEKQLEDARAYLVAILDGTVW